jgi:hypothetical protein
MNRDCLEQILRDFQSLRDPNGDPELEALKTAILLEDVFDIHLSDADIDPGVLADPAAIVALVSRSQDPT